VNLWVLLDTQIEDVCTYLSDKNHEITSGLSEEELSLFETNAKLSFYTVFNRFLLASGILVLILALALLYFTRQYATQQKQRNRPPTSAVLARIYGAIMKTYTVHCSCNRIELSLCGEPRARVICHCIDCRELLDGPFYPVTVWTDQTASITRGESNLSIYKHPRLKMKKYFCTNCGEVLFNTNSVDWRAVPQWLIAKNHNNQLPRELTAVTHVFYEQRIIDVSDNLPKHLRGFSSPLFEG